MELKHFDFYVCYWDVDEYCFWICDTYGEKSDVIIELDKDFYRLTSQHKDAKDILMDIRELLVAKGFADVVEKADIAFRADKNDRGLINPYTPPSKRKE